MSKCVNDKCNKNPFDDELKMVLATSDADFACCHACLVEFEEQREEFFTNIGSDKWYNNYMFGN